MGSSLFGGWDVGEYSDDGFVEPSLIFATEGDFFSLEWYHMSVYENLYTPYMYIPWVYSTIQRWVLALSVTITHVFTQCDRQENEATWDINIQHNEQGVLGLIRWTLTSHQHASIPCKLHSIFIIWYDLRQVPFYWKKHLHNDNWPRTGFV